MRAAAAAVAVAVTVAVTVAGAAELESGRTAVVVASRPGAAPERGPRSALVTVELFCNFAHTHCALTEGLLHELAARHPDGLRVVYRMVVPPFRDSEAIAEATLEAWSQGRFLELADLIGAAGAPVRLRDLDGLAARAGLDVDALHRALADQRHATALRRDAVLRDRLGIGTFASVWNGVAQPTELNLESFERAYAKAAERARALVAEGVAAERVYPLLAAEAQRAHWREVAAAVDASAPRARVPTDGAPARGADNPDVTIVLFNDFECAPCRRNAEVVAKVLALYPDRVRVVWKNLPAPFHPSAMKAAEVAACAELQGKFWELYDALVTSSSRLFASDVEHAIDRSGLDLVRLRSDMANGRCSGRIDSDVADAKAAGVEAAPTLFVNGLRLSGAQGLSSLRQVVEAELAPGLLETMCGELTGRR